MRYGATEKREERQGNRREDVKAWGERGLRGSTCTFPSASLSTNVFEVLGSSSSCTALADPDGALRLKEDPETDISLKIVRLGERSTWVLESFLPPPGKPSPSSTNPRGAARRAQMLFPLAPLQGTCTITWQRTRVLYSTRTSSVRVIVAHRTSTVVVSYCARGFG